MSTYNDFLASKRRVAVDVGHDVDPEAVHPSLFPFQRTIVTWALRKGRAAIFADTGLGKTRMQVEWARLTGQRTLILSPLAVTHQTVAEAEALGVDVAYARHQGEAEGQITITNYERLDRFDPAEFGAVVLDESSILKAFSGTTKKALVTAFKATPYRLCCTATPAPNDIEELCNHADFLSVMSPAEMRSTFFIADDRGRFMKYRLKGHARTAFFRWLSSWAVACRRPSDLGFDDDGFDLPPLEVVPHVVDTGWTPGDRLFAIELRGITEQSAARRDTLEARVRRAVELVAEDNPDERWLIWCGRNDEADALMKALPNAVEVRGSDPADVKAARLLDFAQGNTQIVVTKPGIAGWGLNFQRCARIVFCGLSYSYEEYYQAVRRCWRYGQTRPVLAHVVVSDAERSVWEAIEEKERQAVALSGGLAAEVSAHNRAELFAGTSAGDCYEPSSPIAIPDWLVTA